MRFPSVPFSFFLMQAGTLGDNLDWQSGKAFGLFFNIKKAIFDFKQIPIKRKEGVVCPLFFA
jgi:hypothetical protein